MNILVTGANGFIGHTFIKTLKNSSHNISGLDITPPSEKHAKYLKDFYKQDISQSFKINDSFDFVFHLAACNLTNINAADYNTYHEVNVLGTENLIKATVIKKFVLMSTTKVYQNNGNTLDESSPINPVRDYEKSKLQAEGICRRYFQEDNLTILRSTNVIGPGQAEKAVIPIFFKQARGNETLEILGSRKCVLQPLYVDDLIDAFKLLLENKKACGIFNISSQEAVTLGELAQNIIDICGSESQINAVSNDDIIFSKVVSDKVQNTIGWQAKTSIPEILTNYYEFTKKENG